MSTGLGQLKSGAWCFVASFRFKRTEKDGRKVFFNRQGVPISTIGEILSILRTHCNRLEFHDEAVPNEPANGGVLDLTADGRSFSGKIYPQTVRFSWQFKKSTLILLPGDELDCKGNFHWISGKADPRNPLQGTLQARIQFSDFELLSWATPQLVLLNGPRKQHYKNLARTVKIMHGPGDSREFRVKCLVPSHDVVKTNRMSLLIYTDVSDHFHGVQAIYEWKDRMVETPSSLILQLSQNPLDLSVGPYQKTVFSKTRFSVANLPPFDGNTPKRYRVVQWINGYVKAGTIYKTVRPHYGFEEPWSINTDGNWMIDSPDGFSRFKNELIANDIHQTYAWHDEVSTMFTPAAEFPIDCNLSFRTMVADADWVDGLTIEAFNNDPQGHMFNEHVHALEDWKLRYKILEYKGQPIPYE